VSNEIDLVLAGVFAYVIPEIVLGLGACIVFLGTTMRPNRHLWGIVTLGTLVVAGVALYLSPVTATAPPAAIYAGPVFVDSLAVLMKALALAGGVVLLLCSWDTVSDQHAGEYHACLLLIVAGLCLTACSNELVTLFLALELTSIPTYVILYLPRHDKAGQEAAMKYFLLSVFSSALFLFGLSYLYGLAGTTNLPAIMAAVAPAASGLPALAPAAVVLILAGLGFRITAVPFHFYAPDVYQGTATPNAALLAFVPKVAGFVALIRVLGFVLPGSISTGFSLMAQMPSLLWILAAVTMTLGNVLALLQDNLKRLLAYSSVAHAGYMLIGLAVAPSLRGEGLDGGIDAVLFYLMGYAAMTIGAFAVLIALSTPQKQVETFDDLAGLGSTHPGLAAFMTLFLFSLIGIPLTAGFAGKLLIFWGAMAVPGAEPDQLRLFRLLALIGVINAAIGGWYYLRIVAVMYLRTALKPLDRVRSVPGVAALWICALVTLALGMYPRPFLQWTRDAAGQVPAGEARAEASVPMR
jgi:NADH-quinone oxidoreductase subunit N